MAKVRVTFEADQSILFDRLLMVQGSTDTIGNRLVMALMPATNRFNEDMVMDLYGITVTNREDI